MGNLWWPYAKAHFFFNGSVNHDKSVTLSQVIHREIVPSMVANNTLEWTVDEITPFDELVVSWNALRPEEGEYAVSVRVKIKEWSEDLHTQSGAKMDRAPLLLRQTLCQCAQTKIL